VSRNPSSSSLPSSFSIQLAGERGSLLVSRPGPAVVCVRVAGHGVEDLTEALDQELEADMVIQGQLTLFIDTRTSGAEILGSPRWALWFRQHRDRLARVIVLVAPGFAKSTGDLARGFAGLDRKLEVLLELAAFERARSDALRSPLISGTWDRPDDGAPPSPEG